MGPAIRPLDEKELSDSLKPLPKWSISSGMLHREHAFRTFADAFSFITSLALISEKLNHHAEIFNCYNKVRLDLKTHDADAITERDIKWAALAEEASEKFI